MYILKSVYLRRTLRLSIGIMSYDTADLVILYFTDASPFRYLLKALSAVFYVSGGNGSEDGSRYPHSEHRDSNESVEVDGNRGTVSHEAEVQSARKDTSRTDASTHNSGFWEQFLTEDPRPVTRQDCEVQLETQDLFQDDKITVQNCSVSPRVDILSHQLGQLAPG